MSNLQKAFSNLHDQTEILKLEQQHKWDLKETKRKKKLHYTNFKIIIVFLEKSGGRIYLWVQLLHNKENQLKQQLLQLQMPEQTGQMEVAHQSTYILRKHIMNNDKKERKIKIKEELESSNT